VSCENLQNELASVKNLEFRRLSEVCQLAGVEIPVKDDPFSISLQAFQYEVFQSPGANDGSRVNSSPTLDAFVNHCDSGGSSQFTEFLKPDPISATGMDTHQGPRWPIDFPQFW